MPKMGFITQNRSGSDTSGGSSIFAPVSDKSRVVQARRQNKEHALVDRRARELVVPQMAGTSR